MQTHSLILNSETWLYLKTTERERQTIRDFARPQRNLDESKETIEEEKSSAGGKLTITKV